MNVPKQSALNQKPPYWYLLDVDEPHKAVVLVCTNGHHSRVRDGLHGIATDGTVVPSCICTEPCCDFHTKVKLADWSATDSYR